MTKTQQNRAIVAILGCLAEVDAAPSGHLYMALQTYDARVYTHDGYMQILALMIRSGVVTEEHGLVALTPKGHGLAREVQALLA